MSTFWQKFGSWARGVFYGNTDSLTVRQEAPSTSPLVSNDRFALPHIMTFQAMLGQAWQVYWRGRHDEALRHDREFALAMRRDLFNMGLLQERQLATASLKWSIQVDNEKDPHEKEVKEVLTKAIQRTPLFQQLVINALEAIWHGRSGVQLRYDWTTINDRRALVIAGHQHVEGDKIGFLYDHTPTVQIFATAAKDLPDAEIIPNSGDANVGSHALVLRGTWRERFLIHKHRAIDESFSEWERADAIHGIGIRDVIHWWEWLKMEWLGNITDWCERAGLGLRIYYYPSGNDAAKREASRAAKENTRRTNIIVPVDEAMRGHPAVEWQDVGTAGPTTLLQLIEYIDKGKERYIIGQHMSSGDDSSNSLGGTGKANFAENTKHNLVRFDAQNFAETFTNDFLRIAKAYTFPELPPDLPCRFVFNLDDPDPAGVMDAVNKAYSMGVDFRKSEVRALTGMSDPQPGDDVISQQQQQQQQGGMGVPGDQPAGLGSIPGVLPEEGQPPEETPPATDDESPEIADQYASALGLQERYLAYRRDGSWAQYAAFYSAALAAGSTPSTALHDADLYYVDALHYAESGDEWGPYQGKRGGKGWKNSRTGKIVYGPVKPGGRKKSTGTAGTTAAPKAPKAPKAVAPKAAAPEKPKPEKHTPETATAKIREIQQAAGNNLTAEHLGQIGEVLGTMTVADIGKVKAALGVKASGAKAELVKKIAERLANPKLTKKEKPASATKDSEPWEGGGVQFGKVYNAPTAALTVDPQRFQFKINVDKASGVTNEFKNVKKFNPDFAGVIAVWQDPADGKTYVINGHHRHELAKRTGHGDLAIRYIKAKDHVEARSLGALINIAEGRGTSVDAAKFLRDTGLTVQDFEQHGVTLTSKLAQEAIALSRLSPTVFDKVTRGVLTVDTANGIAKHLHDHKLQEQLVSIIDRKNLDGNTTQKMIEEMAKEMAQTPTHTVKDEGGLFGDWESEESLFVERNEIKAHLRQDFAKEISDFKAVSSKRRAEKVGKVGNVLDTETNKEIAEESQRALNQYDLLVNRKGIISDTIDQFAAKLAAAKTKGQISDVKRQAAAAVRDAVHQEMGLGNKKTTDGGSGDTPATDAIAAGATDKGRGNDSANGLSSQPAAPTDSGSTKEPHEMTTAEYVKASGARKRADKIQKMTEHAQAVAQAYRDGKELPDAVKAEHAVMLENIDLANGGKPPAPKTPEPVVPESSAEREAPRTTESSAPNSAAAKELGLNDRVLHKLSRRGIDLDQQYAEQPPGGKIFTKRELLDIAETTNPGISDPDSFDLPGFNGTEPYYSERKPKPEVTKANSEKIGKAISGITGQRMEIMSVRDHFPEMSRREFDEAILELWRNSQGKMRLVATSDPLQYTSAELKKHIAGTNESFSLIEFVGEEKGHNPFPKKEHFENKRQEHLATQQAQATEKTDPAAKKATAATNKKLDRIKAAIDPQSPLQTQLENAADTDSFFLDGLEKSGDLARHGIHHNEFLRTLSGEWGKWERSKKWKGDLKDLENRLQQTGQLVQQRLVPALRKMAQEKSDWTDNFGEPLDLNELADHYETVTPQLLDRIKKAAGLGQTADKPEKPE